MRYDAQTLYDLLPAVYRIRDSEQGYPLKALLSVIAEEIGVIEEDLAQLYDDHFIETASDWAVPYIGDAIGYRQLYGVVPKVSSPRAEVANTIGYRRRKGTAAMLERLARDVTDWGAHVVEFFGLLATTQYMNHIRTANQATPDLRRWEALERLGTPFDSLAHTADVRRISSNRGKYNIPNVGIFLWRLGAHPLTDSPAFRLDARRYLFSPLGNNAPLYNRPDAQSDDVWLLARPINVPMPLSRRVLDRDIRARSDQAGTRYYGRGNDLLLKVGAQEVGPERIVVCDLSDADAGAWNHMPKRPGRIAVDPVLGRIAFAEDQQDPIYVTFHYGFSADMGGGEYEREASFEDLGGTMQVGGAPDQYPTIGQALGALPAGGGTVEITDNGRYREAPAISVAATARSELRAKNGCRPALVLGRELVISGDADAEVTINGLLIMGGSLRVTGQVGRLCLRHCTLVPGLQLFGNSTPRHPATPSLIVESATASVEIDGCIVGGLRVDADATVTITDSIVDATGEGKVAYAGPDGRQAGGALSATNATIIGRVRTTKLDASNTIFLAKASRQGGTWLAPVQAERRQKGCIRFSYVPPGSRVPRRYCCQPESKVMASHVRPLFTSLRYGDPGYCQLSARCAAAIRQGADDEAEIGAFHRLYQPQRETNLRVRLDEYLRFGLEAGIFYAS